MEKKYKHKPSGNIFVRQRSFHSVVTNGSTEVPMFIVESGSDWEDVKPEKINVGLTSAGNLPSDQKVMFIVDGHFEPQNISQFSSLLNGESFTREDMIEFATYNHRNAQNHKNENLKTWLTLKNRYINR